MYPEPVIDAEFTEEPSPAQILKDLDDWAARLPKPLTMGSAKDYIQEAIAYGGAVYDRTVGLSTQPLMGLIAPKLAEALKDAIKIREGLKVYLSKGAKPETRFNPDFEAKLSQRIVQYGTKIYQEAYTFVSDSHKQHDKVASWFPGFGKKDDSIPFWKIATSAVLGIAAVVAVKELIETVKS